MGPTLGGRITADQAQLLVKRIVGERLIVRARQNVTPRFIPGSEGYVMGAAIWLAGGSAVSRRIPCYPRNAAKWSNVS